MPKKNYKILSNLLVDVVIDQNPYSIPLENVFSMAARDNPKRKYLFVSELIGKHIPVSPQTPLLTGFLLASRLAECLGIASDPAKINAAVDILLAKNIKDRFPISTYNLSGKALFLGFAETATALGHAVFDCFSENVSYLHTTRENLAGSHSTIYFTEDHCHAPEQKCVVFNPRLFENNDFIVLIDDEITTGNLGLNMIRAIQKQFPQKHYIILALLDWRSTAAKQKYAITEKELGIKIDVVSLLSGSFTVSEEKGSHPFLNSNVNTVPVTVENLPAVEQLAEPFGAEIKISDDANLRYLRCTGRFGINKKDMSNLKSKAKKLGEKLRAGRKGKRTLCLGTGEFMYIPFYIASYMGQGISVQSTTRSPVHPWSEPGYAVKQAITFYDPFKPGIKNFVYNIPPFYYDEVYIFWEREISPQQVQPLVAALNKLGISNITFISHIERV